MTTARDIMTPGAPSLGGTHTVGDAARTMQELGVESLPLCGPEGRFHGVVMHRDILRTLRALGTYAEDLKARHLAQSGAATVDAGDSIEKVIVEMALSQRTELPVLDGTILVGTLSHADVARETPVIHLEELAEHISGQ